MRTRWACRRTRRGPAAVALVLVALLPVVGACGARPGTDSAPTPAVSTTESVPLPADGVSLRTFGYVFGPVDAFSLPRTTLLTASVDQADNVTVVLSDPPAVEVAAYLRRALPPAGFRITADDPAVSTLTFAGRGWTGSFTGDGATSAVLLRPQPG